MILNFKFQIPFLNPNLSNPRAHRRFLLRMLAAPPVQVVEVAAEPARSAFDQGHLYAVRKMSAAFAADSGCAFVRLDVSVPGDAAVSALVESGGINRTDGFTCARVPVLAVGPVVTGDRRLPDLTKGPQVFIWGRVTPDALIAAVESACAAVIRSAVGHEAV